MNNKKQSITVVSKMINNCEGCEEIKIRRFLANENDKLKQQNTKVVEALKDIENIGNEKCMDACFAIGIKDKMRDLAIEALAKLEVIK